MIVLDSVNIGSLPGSVNVGNNFPETFFFQAGWLKVA